MNLLIISNMPHYLLPSGQVVGHGPTAREISYLATIFDQVTHIACLYPGQPPAMMLPYQSHNIKLIPVPPAGGEHLKDKADIVRRIPQYVRTILRELPRADVVHVRCPANISLLAIVLLAFAWHPRLRWLKYAGNWKPDNREAWSYTFQRWWLKSGFHRGEVTVNGQWPGQPTYVHSFLNPCLTNEEILDGHRGVSGRHIDVPLRLLFVGQLLEPKGVRQALQILAELRRRQINATLDIVGDGPERRELEAQVHTLGIQSHVYFHGWLPRTALGPVYGKAHFLVLPTSSSEGWPKVLSEAMAYGAVPIAGNVSSIPQYLEAFHTGRAIPAHNVSEYVEAIVWYTQHPEQWQIESGNGIKVAYRFAYSYYLESVSKLLNLG